MATSARLHLPSLEGATARLNSGPLGPAELRGRVVLVNFRTLYVHQLAAPGAVRARVVAGLPRRARLSTPSGDCCGPGPPTCGLTGD